MLAKDGKVGKRLPVPFVNSTGFSPKKLFPGLPRLARFYRFSTELYSIRRLRLDRPEQKAVVFMLNPNNLCNTCMA